MDTIQESIEHISLLDTYKSRIKELNEIIGNLNTENYDLKKSIENISDLSMDIVKICICKYTPYMVRNAMFDIFNIKLSSGFIINTASKNGFFEHDFLALRIPKNELSKEGSKYQYATIIFSTVGIIYLLDILYKECVINKNMGTDSIDKSFKELKEGRVKKYTLKELRDMEK